MQQPTPSHALSVKQELSQLRRHTQTRPPAWGVVRNKRPERLLTATTAWAYDKINTTELSHNFTPTGFLAHHNFVTVTWTWHVLLHAQNTPSPRHIFVKLIIIHHLSFDDWTRRGVIVLVRATFPSQTWNWQGEGGNESLGLNQRYRYLSGLNILILLKRNFLSEAIIIA